MIDFLQYTTAEQRQAFLLTAQKKHLPEPSMTMNSGNIFASIVWHLQRCWVWIIPTTCAHIFVLPRLSNGRTNGKRIMNACAKR